MTSLSELPELSPAEVGKTLDAIAEIGNRYQGSQGEAECRDYLCARFEGLGLADVRLESFPYLAYEGVDATCLLVAPERQQLDCTPLQHTADTEMEGEAIYIGAGELEDLDRLAQLGVDLAAKVVVAHTQHPFRIAPHLKERHIGGLVVVSEVPDDVIPYYGADFSPIPAGPPWTDRPLPFPGVTIGALSGRRLISTMTTGRPVTLRVEHRASYVPREASNVVGEIKGGTDECVLAGAHYDTQVDVPGVWDNGTGLAGILELARAFVGMPLRRTVVIAAFAVEEGGLWGSSAYTATHGDQLERLTGMVNLDALASRYPGRRWMATNPAMRAFAVETATMHGWPPEVVIDSTGRRGSDHAPFGEAGVPACFLIDYPSYPHPCYHTRDDTRDIVDEIKVTQVASVSGAVMWRLATGTHAPPRS